MKIAILNYNAGNIRSVKLALNRVGIDSVITDDIKELSSADKVIIPGVGAAGAAMAYLRDKGLDQVILNLKQPVLGICLGLQLLCQSSEEDNTECLGVFPAKVELFKVQKKVPHTGWNSIFNTKSELFSLLKCQEDVYFVHSYRAGLLQGYTVAECHYDEPFSAALKKDNFYATQFHPEKSGLVGEQILRSFVAL